MKKGNHFFYSFRAKVTFALIFATVFVSALSGLLIHKFSLDEQIEQLRQRLMVIAQTATFALDPELVSQIQPDKSAIQTEAYKQTVRKLAQIKEANPSILYIYVMTRLRTPDTKQLVFLADPDPYYDAREQRGPSAYPGDPYDASSFPEMFEAFEKPSADWKVVADQWGPVLSGYAPIRDASGKTLGILGVDIMAQDVWKMRRQVNARALMVLGFGILLALGVGFLVSHRLTDGIGQVVEGTKRLAADDLDYQVPVKGRDEIADLAISFNQMAADLSRSREKLQDYFFRSMQSLVRILEAKDSYTCGHSERVAVYAEKVGQQMGFSKKEVTVLRKAALLHDIGKLVVHENVLNKEGALNDAEWKMIMEHPVVGEEVVKPLEDDEMISRMIRSHHERYDGKGYPDKKSGQDTHVFAQIICAVDAYDAMTTHRAYRRSLSKEKAVEELRRHSGTQFNPQVVEAFLKVLETS